MDVYSYEKYVGKVLPRLGNSYLVTLRLDLCSLKYQKGLIDVNKKVCSSITDRQDGVQLAIILLSQYVTARSVEQNCRGLVAEPRSFDRSRFRLYNTLKLRNTTRRTKV